MSKQSGFTLVELIITLIIVGILSVVAIPRLFDFSSDARKAAVQGMEAAMESALSLTLAKARVNHISNKLNQNLTLNNGDIVRLDYGYPEHNWNTAWQFLLDGDFSVKGAGGFCEDTTEWCVDSDFNISADVTVPGSSSAVVIWPRGKDTKDNCYAYYAFSAAKKGNVPRIGSVLSGC